MSHSSTANPLRTCPECGGILEPTRPAWAVTIAFTAGAGPTSPGAPAWRCLLCGYHERTDAGDPAAGPGRNV